MSLYDMSICVNCKAPRYLHKVLFPEFLEREPIYTLPEHNPVDEVMCLKFKSYMELISETY